MRLTGRPWPGGDGAGRTGAGPAGPGGRPDRGGPGYATGVSALARNWVAASSA